MAVFSLSDLHVDYDENRDWLRRLPETAHRRDALIVAGDISDDLGLVEDAFRLLVSRFETVCFVPGNHDLWVRSAEGGDSVEKFRKILALCARLGVETEPVKVGEGHDAVWLVPLFGWYLTPEEGEDSLFVPKQGRDLTMALWSDRAFIHWPQDLGAAADMFTFLNEPHLNGTYDVPVISYSHFLPRSDLIFPSEEEMLEIRTMPAKLEDMPKERHSIFNFSRVAGTRVLEQQLRRLGAAVHVYGHQHRNRVRKIDGVRYVSYSLGYPQEREREQVQVNDHQPLLVWGGG